MNLKEKFENYTQPVDESGWESIANDPALVRYNRGRLVRRICGYGIPALVVTAVGAGVKVPASAAKQGMVTHAQGIGHASRHCRARDGEHPQQQGRWRLHPSSRPRPASGNRSRQRCFEPDSGNVSCCCNDSRPQECRHPEEQFSRHHATRHTRDRDGSRRGQER